MGGDYARWSFDALRDFAGVLIQQGHPILDADWNEQVALLDRRWRAQTVDTLGRATVPRETPTGFQVQLAAGPALRIGRGRMYLDGLLVENHGRIGADAPAAFDRARLENGQAVGVLDEAISQAVDDFIDYRAQPYWPVPDPLPEGPGPHVTPLKDPSLLEPALNGIDTATRWQTVWQVRVLADAGEGAQCGSPLAAWDALTAPSPARLTTATVEFEDPDDPCLIPPGGGYRGLENQLYRVEIHTGGPLGQARFKWSRDNASVGATVEIFPAADRLTVRQVGRDAVLRLHTGDWVEVTDDRREFNGRAGDLRRVEVDEDTLELRFDTPLSADLVPSGLAGDTPAARHSRVIKWDQSGPVLRPDGSEWVDLDDAASDGLIPIPADGGPLVLDAGITVQFGSAVAGGSLRALDHWVFAARTATRAIEVLTEAPPAGIHHHHARLAVVRFPDAVSDCRVLWPPAFESGCGCTQCVSADEHNSGARTLQQAIDALGNKGGTVCLAPGDYALGDTPVVIANRTAVRLRGHGAETRLIYAGEGGAVRVFGCTDTVLTDLGIAALNPRGSDARGPTMGLHLRNVTGVRAERCQILMLSPEANGDAAIGIDGVALSVTLEAIAAFGFFGLRSLAGVLDPDGNARGPRFTLLTDLAVRDCALLARRRGIALEDRVIHLGPTQIEGNLILAQDTGIAVTGVGFPVSNPALGEPGEPWSAATVSVRANAIGHGAAGAGLRSAVQDLQALDNTIVAMAGEVDLPLASVQLVEGLLPQLLPDGQLVGNRLGSTLGAGIRVETAQDVLTVQRNVIRDCGGAGIEVGADAPIGTLTVSDNTVVHVGLRGRGGGSAAIRVGFAHEARLLHNRIDGVGDLQATPLYVAGIELRGAGLLDIAHNAIGGLVPPPERGTAVGILIDGGIGMASLADNRVLGAQNGAVGTSFCAVLIDTSDANAGQPTVSGGGLPAVYTLGDQVFSYSHAVGARQLSANREGLLRICGHQVIDDHERSALPLVLVRVGARVGACSFSDNQCTLLASGAVPAIVNLTAPRLTVTSNVVRRQSDRDAMQLSCRLVGNDPAATVLGNISFGNIRINGNLPAAFAALNILSS
jgi:Family of unknown function (DUF6519)/Right handed beta helix region